MPNFLNTVLATAKAQLAALMLTVKRPSPTVPNRPGRR